MKLSFQKATRKRVKLRIALNGPTGSGKTYSALSIASHLAMPIALIDTEHGSASLYSGDFDFSTLELTNYDPQNYVDALHAAAEAEFPIVIVDSLSHAWAGIGGILDKLDKKKARNKFTAWGELTPQHNRLVEALLTYPGHVIVTMRTKTAYDVDDRGKPVKVGLAPVQREGLEYEFDLVIDMDRASATVSKTRCSDLHDRVFTKPGRDIAEVLKRWMDSDGSEPRAEPRPKGVQHQSPSEPRRRPTPQRDTVEPKALPQPETRLAQIRREGRSYILQVDDHCAVYARAVGKPASDHKWANIALEKGDRAETAEDHELVKLAEWVLRTDYGREIKTLGSNLDQDDCDGILADLGLEPGLKPSERSVEDLHRLVKALRKHTEKAPATVPGETYGGEA